VTTDAVVLRKHKTDKFHDVLLIKRAHEPFKDHFAFPGGFVDYNEDPLEGCLRELKEECNLDGTSIEFVCFNLF
jgi:8-oxo-dGTP diphosphatase